MRSTTTLNRPISQNRSTRSQAVLAQDDPTAAGMEMTKSTVLKNSQIVPTAKALLESNKDFLFPHRSVNISPYEIKEYPFTTSDISSSGFSHHQISKDSAAVGIDNFDPSIPTQFSDPITLKAIKRLGIQQSDCFYPNSEELETIGSRDNNNNNNNKERIISKVNKIIEAVRQEKEKLLRLEPKAEEQEAQNVLNSNYTGNKRSKSENKPPICMPSRVLSQKTKREIADRKVRDSKYRNIQLPPSNEIISNRSQSTKTKQRSDVSEVSERMVAKEKPKLKAPITHFGIENRIKAGKSKFTRASIEIEHPLQFA